MVNFTNILDKMKVARHPAWLFLSYDLDKGDITAVRRVAKDDPQWADWNLFVYEQVERCMADPVNLPNERVYAFSFPNLEDIPYLGGVDNNHYIDFVSKSVPVYQLGILECAYAREQGIQPVRLREAEHNYDGFAAFMDAVRIRRDEGLFRQTVAHDSQNYELLYDLVARYTDLPEVTRKQIEWLNDSPAGLRIFSVLEELFRSSEYVAGTMDYDDYAALVYTPVADRHGLHYLKAELDKFDYMSGRKGADDPQKDKKILELTLYIRRFEIKPDWEQYGPDREWFSACIARMTDAEMIAREIRNFSYVPALTRAQLQYLMRTGTTAETLFGSSIMGDVIMETPFFRESYGLDLSGMQGRKLDTLDHLVVEASRLVVESSLAWLHDVMENPEESEETKQMAADKIPEVEGYLHCMEGFANRTEETLQADNEQEVLQALGTALERARDYHAAHPFTTDGSPVPGEAEVVQALSADPSDTALSAKMAALLAGEMEQLPLSLLSRCLSVLSSQSYGQLPENRDLKPGSLLAGQSLGTPLQQLSAGIEYRRMAQSLTAMQEEMEEMKRTERRIQNEINDLYDRIGDCRSGMKRLRVLLNGQKEEK